MKHEKHEQCFLCFVILPDVIRVTTRLYLYPLQQQKTQKTLVVFFVFLIAVRDAIIYYYSYGVYVHRTGSYARVAEYFPEPVPWMAHGSSSTAPVRGFDDVIFQSLPNQFLDG